MIYAQFYQQSATNPHNVIEACGDRSVVIYDGRLNRASVGRDAAAEAKRRGYVAWRIFKGESFTRSAAISQLNYVDTGKPITPSASSAYYGA